MLTTAAENIKDPDISCCYRGVKGRAGAGAGQTMATPRVGVQVEGREEVKRRAAHGWTQHNTTQHPPEKRDKLTCRWHIPAIVARCSLGICWPDKVTDD